MKKQSSSRSQRGSRGIKGKHVVQICVLLGVCIWLIYQVKYSHDKKKELYEGDVKKSTVLLENEEGMVKLGRKDLLPGYHKQNEKEKRVEEEEEDEEEEEKESKSRVENSSTHEEEEKEDEEDEEEEDKNKLGEEVVEEDEEENKHEEEDDIDEQDQSKDDELLQEEKEKEAETNHADEIDVTVHEAREEHYKADDTSSAVSHESRILNTEKLNESYGNSTGPSQENSSNTTTNEVGVQKEPVLKLGEAESKDSVEKTVNAVTELRGETVNGNSTEAVLEASGFVQNETRTMQERSQEHDKTEDGAPPSGSSDLQNVVELEQTRNETDANITVSANITNTSSIQDEFRNSTSESSLVENISGSNTTEVVKESSTSEGDEETEEKESSNHFATEQTEEADDTPESTMLQEEREALTDPQTLPDISIEGKEEEDEEEAMAAE
ncbi:hypothetical protein HID58_000409 [Brassica napus]|uniref:Uncharacterized protein n=1 Tax=Brassica napus TaxID=3708 RepID=A0ABQ8EGE4_BRANA|nr:cilia- and flagella-associated protein 251 [Brassica napus]XP_013656084.2 cilia- and flagella-associated protein 251 [Brassica napus]XP_013656156.2 cilia- and flagella-associated protein 251 [Brassica napus]XP_013656222.2 cilia- and flagella-associated protein 251 [Brassica napus]XP_022548904.2 cilia- and flagella-associated protein 251 [Brassica napus]XP_048635462.1 cilia- and flagella-associated protein 251 [Brassica napus]KAH0940772.1 hypothetical protein HID58_000409 [Brassica napus]